MPDLREKVARIVSGSPFPSMRSFAKADAILEALEVGWRAPTEVPDVKRGDFVYRIVAVKRAHSGKVVSFGAFYLNEVPLHFEDEEETRPVTGWNTDREGDEGPVYEELLGKDDDLMGWREFPEWQALPTPPEVK